MQDAAPAMGAVDSVRSDTRMKRRVLALPSLRSSLLAQIATSCPVPPIPYSMNVLAATAKPKLIGPTPAVYIQIRTR